MPPPMPPPSAVFAGPRRLESFPDRSVFIVAFFLVLIVHNVIVVVVVVVVVVVTAATAVIIVLLLLARALPTHQLVLGTGCCAICNLDRGGTLLELTCAA